MLKSHAMTPGGVVNLLLHFQKHKLGPSLDDAPRESYGMKSLLHITWTLRKAYMQKKIISTTVQILAEMGFSRPPSHAPLVSQVV